LVILKTITTLLQYILHQNIFEIETYQVFMGKGAGPFTSIHEKCKAWIEYKY